MTARNIFSTGTAFAMFIGATTLVGCGGSDAPSPTALPEPRDVYPGIRGEIVQLPSDGPPPTELRIHHEHIPGFLVADGSIPVRTVTVDGEQRSVPGMRAMKMDFGLLAEDVDAASLALGDIVAFDLFVSWGERGVPTYWIGNVSPLPADTELNFGDLEFERIARDEDAEAVD